MALYNPIGYSPNPRLAGGLAMALMPTRDFAKERADRAANLQLLQYENATLEQEAQQKRTALAETQNLLSKVDQANLLAPDKARLTASVVEPFRAQLENVIRDQYGGDVLRFSREKGDFYARKFAQDLTRNPLFTQATRNMTNYTLAEDARQKGKLIVGNYDAQRAAFEQGLTDRIDFAGAYDAPKQVWDYFAQNYKNGDKYGQVVKGRGGKEQYVPYAVTKDDVYGRLLDSGLTPLEAQDYMRRINYQGGKYWRKDEQSPWDAQAQAAQLQNMRNSQALGWANYGLNKQELAARMEDRAAERENKRQIALLKERGLNADGTPTINQQLFNPAPSALQPLRNANNQPVKLGDGRTISYAAGVQGETGAALAKAAGFAGNINRQNQEGFTVPIPSSITRVSLPSGRAASRADGKPFEFQSVQTDRIYYIPDTKRGGAPTPHLMAVVNLPTGKTYSNGNPEYERQSVFVPIQPNQLTMGELANQGIFNSDEKRGQRWLGPPQQPAAAPTYLPSPTPPAQLQQRISSF